MTRKHFNAIAEVLREHSASDELVADLARVLAETNPGFNYLRFIQAALGDTK